MTEPSPHTVVGSPGTEDRTPGPIQGAAPHDAPDPESPQGGEMSWDVVVVGLGILGATALRELAIRGHRVVGVDALEPPHPHGSSHGTSRIIRDAYFEHPLYVPLVQRARAGWRELEEESGARLLLQTGLLLLGHPQGQVIRGSLRSAETHHLPVERLTPEEVLSRWPGLQVPEGITGVFETTAGVLAPEAAVAAALAGARRRGARVLTGEQVVHWSSHPTGVRIRTRHRELRARTLILAAGSWLGPLAGGRWPGLLRAERQVTFRFREAGTGLAASGALDPLPPDTASLATPRTRPLPVILWEPEPGSSTPAAYLIPEGEGILKLARHHGGVDVDTARRAPGTLDREISRDEWTEMRRTGEALLGGLGPEVDAATCLYTNTPDGHFLVGPHPDHARVLLLGGGSGHAFKFAPVLAARVADLVPGGLDHWSSEDGGPRRASLDHGIPEAGPERSVAHLWPEDPGDDPFSPGRFATSSRERVRATPPFLDDATIRERLTVEMALEAGEEAFRAVSRGEVVQPVRTHLHLPDGQSQFIVMPGHLGRPAALGTKLITLFPGNREAGLPSHLSLIVLFDPETGALRTLLDGARITALRTAAASAVATRTLALPEASELTLLGAGVQARSHLEAILAVRPIRRVRVWSRTTERLDAFLEWARGYLASAPAGGPASAPGGESAGRRRDIVLEAAPDPRSAVKGAHIICTLTASPAPLVKGEWLEPGMHLNAVGSHTPDAREMDTEAVIRSRCYVDQRAAALAEAGEFRIPLDRGEITEAHLLGEMGEVLEGTVPGRQEIGDITLFKSLGLAAQDLATAARLVAQVGRPVEEPPL